MPMPYQKILVRTFGTIIAASLCACDKEGPVTLPGAELAQPSKSPTPGISGPVTIDSYQLEKTEDGQLVLKGSGKNNTNAMIGKAVATFTLLDGTGKVNGKVSTEVSKLGAQFGWEFQTPISDNSSTAAKLTDISITN